MLKLLRHNFKEVRWFYFWEIVIVMIIGAMLISSNLWTPRRVRVNFLLIIIPINLIFNTMVTIDQLNDRKGRLIFLTGITGKKFISAKIIEFLMVQLLTDVIMLFSLLIVLKMENGLARFMIEYYGDLVFSNFAILLYIVFILSVIIFKTFIKKIKVAAIIAVIIAMIVLVLEQKLKGYISSVEPVGTIAIKIEEFSYMVTRLLKVGQPVWNNKYYINIFFVMAKLGILAGTFILASKAIDKKLDVV